MVIGGALKRGTSYSITMSFNTPLRDELIQWAGFKWSEDNQYWYREGCRLCVRFVVSEWHAVLLSQKGQEAPYVCKIESLARLITLCLAIDGDDQPLQLQIPSHDRNTDTSLDKN